MLDLYTWRTPNGRKVPILLAELELPYQLHLVDLGKHEQKTPAYLAINPNGKIPALVDRDGSGEPVRVFESGAILQYLADKTGRLLPRGGAARAEVMSWLFWQVGGPGPTFGQLGQVAHTTPRDDAAYDRLVTEARRQVGVLDRQLRDREYIAGDYSIADIACYPWFVAMAEGQALSLDGAEHVAAWMARLAIRPAVVAGMSVAAKR
ncbi:MAG TPA: glutathione S-transferase N-terminal domain-containing protein [Kofleriaceae bacterium]|nr:glutathione S-transferase N-terminal domain-containing protein [Kofleriaceae bacterium]